MKSSVLFILCGFIVVAVAAYFFTRKYAVSSNESAPVESFSQTKSSSPGANEIDDQTSLPLAVVLFDRVNFESEGDNDIVVLNTGDALKLLEESKVKTGKFKAKLKNGKSGWVMAAQIVTIPNMKSFNVFYNSTELLSSYFYNSDELDPDTRKKYDELTTTDFIDRAKNNPDSTVAIWAQELEMANQEDVTEVPNIEANPDN